MPNAYSFVRENGKISETAGHHNSVCIFDEAGSGSTGQLQFFS